MTTYAQELFDSAVALEEGQSVLVECYSRGQMNSLRVLLARERKKFLDSTQADFDIIISSKTERGRNYIIITKGKEVNKPVIIDRDGTVLKKAELPKVKPKDGNELERIASLMREDGYSEEEISKHLTGKEN